MTKKTKTLITFATRWGTQFGGINSFNSDLLSAFSAAFYSHVQTVCVVLFASQDEKKLARSEQVDLVTLNLLGVNDFSDTLEPTVWQALQASDIGANPDEAIWLGHDRITGAIAIAAAKARGGKSALIHHMSYGQYEAFAENSAVAHTKESAQKQLFRDADTVLAVGPLLRDALADMLGGRNISMLVPGLPEIAVQGTPNTFKAFLSGRLHEDARKVKQAHLGLAAFAEAIRRCDEDPSLPDALRGASEPRMILRGVDFENSEGVFDPQAEQELKTFAERYSSRAFALNALPFTTDREALFHDLRGASVAMMPSWHEGFGLVAWEAIAAGVPLILSNKSGVYRLLQELDSGLYTSLVTCIDVAGSHSEPYFQKKDLDVLAQALTQVAKDPKTYKGKAVKLREALSNKYSWSNCARQMSDALNWNFPQVDAAVAVATKSPTTPAAPTPAPPSALSSLIELPFPVWQLNPGLSDSQLLRAEEAVVPFDANHEPFLRDQMDWAQSDEYPLAVRLLTGQGGVGKTRLALELCQRLQAPNWKTGFLRSECDVNTASHLGRQIGQAEENFCVVLDYAETRQPVFLALLKALIATRPRAKVRILLLARNGGEWWSMLPARDTACEALLDGTASSGPFVVPQLHDSEVVREQAYQLALNTFAARLNINPPDNQPSLGEAHFAHPLYIQMAALMALRGERPKSAEALPRALVNHERRYWRKALSGFVNVSDENEQQAALLMTLATLSGGIVTDRTIEPVWRHAGGDKALLKPLFKTLAPLYPGWQGLQGLRPDLLGEALVAQTLLGSNGSSLLEAVLSKGDARLRHASLTILARLLRHRPEIASTVEDALSQHFAACASELVDVCIETPSMLPHLAERAFGRLAKQQRLQIAGTVGRKIDFDVWPLVGLKMLICEDELARAKSKLGQPKPHTKYTYAHANALHDLSLALYYNGANDAALKSSQEALEIYQELAKSKPESFEPAWANSLNTYGSRLSGQGHHDGALVASKQALDIYRKLAQNDPKRFEPSYAMSLSNYANRLSAQGQNDEALEASKQASEIYQKLAEKDPERFKQNCARSLNNYASRLAEQGQHDTALEASKQALDICQKLFQSRPERFEPDWASSLNNYAGHLSNQGRQEEALFAAKQALDIYRKLAQNKPERFEPDWAMSLGNYASGLSDQGQHDQALAAAKQGLDIYQNLAQIRPERFEPDWADSLNKNASCLSNQGQQHQALTASEQALKIYQKLALAKPARYLHEQELTRLTCALWQWLATKKVMQDALAVPLPKIAFSADHRSLAFYWSALSALAETETDTGRSETAIQAALDCWSTLDRGQQRSYEELYLLLAGLAEHRLGAKAAPDGWGAQWARYYKRKVGRPPVWMMDAAGRIGFEL